MKTFHRCENICWDLLWYFWKWWLVFSSGFLYLTYVCFYILSYAILAVCHAFTLIVWQSGKFCIAPPLFYILGNVNLDHVLINFQDIFCSRITTILKIKTFAFFRPSHFTLSSTMFSVLHFSVCLLQDYSKSPIPLSHVGNCWVYSSPSTLIAFSL